MTQPADVRRMVRALRARESAPSEAFAVPDVVGQDLLERLAVLRQSPASVLDLGCRDLALQEGLASRYPEARITACDPAPLPSRTAASRSSARWPRWSRWSERSRRNPTPVAADPHALPFADASFELVISNLLLPWCHSPHQVFREIARVLTPGGAFFFTSAGPDTLQEYRARWSTVDAHPHVFGLLDMHDIGDAMLAAGLAEPVLDRDTLQVDYESIDALQHELRHLGATNLAIGRRVGLMAPAVRTALRAGVPQGKRFAVTLELVHGHAWKGELPFQETDSAGDVRVSFESFRRSLKRDD